MKNKKFILTGLAASCIMLGFINYKPTSRKQYDIKGTIKGLTSGMVKLVRVTEDRTEKTIDSSAIINGTFELKGTIDAPEMMEVYFEPGNWSMEVFLENAPITLTVDTANAEHYDYTKYGMGMGKGANIKSFTETGSKNYDEFMAYQHDVAENPYNAAMVELNKKYKEAGSDDNVQDKVKSQMGSLQDRMNAWKKKKIDEYVAQDPSSVASVYMFEQLYAVTMNTMAYNTLDSMLNKFTGDAKKSVYYNSLEKSRVQLKAIQPGAVAPDFTLLERDSTKFSLSSTRGKYILIDFWASWCRPCRQAIPHWKEAFQKYHNRDFDIVSVAGDAEWPAWTKAMDEEKMPWTQVKDFFPGKFMPAQVCAMYLTYSIPAYVLVDKEGKILVYTTDEDKIDAKLKQVFGN